MAYKILYSVVLVELNVRTKKNDIFFCPETSNQVIICASIGFCNELNGQLLINQIYLNLVSSTALVQLI